MMTLKIMPFGNLSREILSAVEAELRDSFGIFCEIQEPLGLPKEFYNNVRHQFLSSKILDFLAGKFSGRILAITDEDLYSEEMNFLFGQAELPGRVAIVSICRLNPTFYKQSPDRELFKERVVKEAVHEFCHAAYGMSHCSNRKCVMSYSSTIFDVDRKEKTLCEECKLRIGI
jgi:archaemetzincin